MELEDYKGFGDEVTSKSGRGTHYALTYTLSNEDNLEDIQKFLNKKRKNIESEFCDNPIRSLIIKPEICSVNGIHIHISLSFKTSVKAWGRLSEIFPNSYIEIVRNKINLWRSYCTKTYSSLTSAKTIIIEDGSMSKIEIWNGYKKKVSITLEEQRRLKDEQFENKIIEETDKKWNKKQLIKNRIYELEKKRKEESDKMMKTIEKDFFSNNYISSENNKSNKFIYVDKEEYYKMKKEHELMKELLECMEDTCKEFRENEGKEYDISNHFEISIVVEEMFFKNSKLTKEIEELEYVKNKCNDICCEIGEDSDFEEKNFYSKMSKIQNKYDKLIESDKEYRKNIIKKHNKIVSLKEKVEDLENKLDKKENKFMKIKNKLIDKDNKISYLENLLNLK